MNKLYLSIILFIFISQSCFSLNLTWTGSTSNSWNDSSNFSPMVVPTQWDTVTVDTTTNHPILSGNTRVYKLIMHGDTLDLNGYQLQTGDEGEFRGGVIMNGNLKCSGTLAYFSGTIIDAEVIATCEGIQISESVFHQKTYFENTGAVSSLSQGGNVFHDVATLKNSSSDEDLIMANSYRDVFHDSLYVIINSAKSIMLAHSDSSTMKGCVRFQSSNHGSISIGKGGGVSIMEDNGHLAVESGDFYFGQLMLMNIQQTSTTGHRMILTTSGMPDTHPLLILTDNYFKGEVDFESPHILLKSNSFEANAILTKSGGNSDLSDGNNHFLANATITNSSTTGYFNLGGNKSDFYHGNVTFTSGSKPLIAGYKSYCYFYKNVEVNSSSVGISYAVWAGDTLQQMSGTHTQTYGRLVIDKPSDKVVAVTPIDITSSVTFTNGHLETDSTNIITFLAGSGAIDASNKSFVSGPVKKVGDTAFDFPVGKIDQFRYISISAPDSLTDAFIAEYISDSVLVNTGDRDSTLGTVLRNKYWSLFRNSGSSQVYVTLSWDTTNSLADTFVVVSEWDGTKWKNLGKGILTGNNESGNIKAATLANTYEEYSIGYLANSELPTPFNCSSVNSAANLQGCLNHATPGQIINITGDVFFSSSTMQLPMLIPQGTTIQGFVGGVSPKWWEANCPVISTDLKFSFHDANCGCTVNPPVGCSTPCQPDALFLFKMEAGATMQNLRIRGASCNYQDYNEDDILCGGIYILSDPSGLAVNIRNCEVSCFSYAGIFKDDENRMVNITNSYIHKVKGRASKGIGYGSWNKGDATPDPLLLYEVTYTNTIFDDCKAAIDGQGDPNDWIINDCTFSQFFLGEDINKHNDNRFKGWSLNNNLDYFYCYSNPNNTCSTECFYGPVCNDLTVQCSHIEYFTINPGYTTDWIDCSVDPDIPVYDVGGGNTRILNSVFHKKWDIQKNGNINLTLPNWDETNNRFGNEDFEIEISQNTFATELHSPTDVANPPYNNRAGYARIADNYIEACVWSGDTRIIKSNNDFNYTLGVPVTSPAVQPFELSLDLKSGGNSLDQSYTPSPNKSQRFIQYIDAGTAFSASFSISNPISGIDEYFVVRPNPNDGTGVDANVISANNYFFNGESITSSNSESVTYDQPGLYGIDVLGFDAQDYGSGERKFKASSWQHIPVIVVDPHPDEEQVLYFNIKDSYQSDIDIGVYKEVRLNNIVIWKEKISAGGSGWEYVRVDLKDNIPNTTDPIKSLINVTGGDNILSFNIFIDSGVDNENLAGLFVWVDDVYIKKSNSTTGDNLIADGSIEFGGVQGIGGNSNSNNYWFSNSTPATYSCIITLPNGSTATLNDNAQRGINETERKSGSYALYMFIPTMNQCNSTFVYDAGLAVSIGTKIDFTDFLSCDDYSDQGFIPFPEGPYLVDLNNPANSNPQPNTNYYIGQDVVLTGTDYLKFAGCKVVIEPDISITINSGTTLEITDQGSVSSHLFACSGMWNGIFNDGGDLKIMPSFQYPSKIEDAKLALLSEGGQVKIRYAEFDHNYMGILLANGNFDYISSSEGLFGIKFKCTDGVISREPFIGIPTTVHIQLENVTGVDIGSSGGTNGAYKNEFSDAGYAIISNNSSARIQNNYFNNLIENSTWCIDCGVGVKITNSGNSTRVIEIGGSSVSTVYERNYFANVNKGIYASNVCPDCSILIKGNSFNNSEFKYTTSGNFYNTAITIQNPFRIIRTPSYPNVEIYNNTINNYRIGIHAIGQSSIEVGGYDPILSVDYGNTINFNLSQFPLTLYHEGIWLQSCPGAKVVKNNITNTTFNTDIKFRGIDIESSPDCHINCNTIEKTGIALNLYANCNLTKLRANIFNSYGTGIMLNGPNGASIYAAQGGTDDAWDNEWNPDGSSNLKVDGQVLMGGQINWYHQGVDNSGNNLSPRPWNTLNGNIINPKENEDSGYITCDDFSRYATNRVANFGSIIGDSANYATDSVATRYQARIETYLAMKNDTTIIYQSDSLDSHFEIFYLTLDSGNVGRFSRIIELAAIDSDSAAYLNAQINPVGETESLLKSFNEMYFDKILSSDTLSPADSTDLEYLTQLSRSAYGAMVHNAAAALFYEVHPEETPSRFGAVEYQNQNVPDVPNANHKVIIYPNPAREMITLVSTLEMRVIELFNSYGSLLIKENLNEKIIEVELNTLPAGVYYVKTTLYSGNIVVAKFILQK